MRIVDYTNLMPGQFPKRTTVEDRERMKKLFEAVKKAAIEHDVKFVLLTKGPKE